MSSDLAVRIDKRDDYAVLYTEGYINNVAGEKIADEFNILYEEGYRSFIFNLDKSSIVNSIGISILIEIIEKIVAGKGKMFFCNLTPVISRTFEIMGLTQYAAVFDDEDQAVSNL
jgi:anti-anti-sigma factor